MSLDPSKDSLGKYIAKSFTISQLFLANQENSELIARHRGTCLQSNTLRQKQKDQEFKGI